MHPFVPVLVSHLLLISTIPFLSPSSSYRPFIVLLVLINCAVSLRCIDPQAWWSDYFAFYVCGFSLHTNYLVCLRKVAPSPSRTTFQKLKWVLPYFYDFRSGIASKNLPSFRVDDPQYVPSKREFLLQRSWMFAWATSGFLFFRRYNLIVHLDDYESPKDQIIGRLMDVSAREWIILVHTSFTTWFMPYSFLVASHSLISILAVTCGDAPGHWRPLFGDVGEAYTMQRFFGTFWHKLMRKGFTGNASFLVCDVIGLPRGASVSRYAILLIAFLISGAIHAIIPPVSVISFSCEGPRILAYYCSAGGAIVLENFLQRIYRHYQKRLGGKGGTGGVGKNRYWLITGYFWVAIFHLWATHRFLYPPVVCMYGANSAVSQE